MTTIKDYKKEFQALKPHDQIQTITDDADTGLVFFMTAGHGYLVVPKSHTRYSTAQAFCKYGYKGKLAVYLEEDTEAPLFADYIKKLA